MPDDNKLITTIATATMMGVFGLCALGFFFRAIAPKEVEYPEPYGMLYLAPAGHIINVDYADEEPTYFGEALPGTPNSAPNWRIYRYEYETIGRDLEVVGIRFANGDTNFDKVWDDRADYDYS